MSGPPSKDPNTDANGDPQLVRRNKSDFIPASQSKRSQTYIGDEPLPMSRVTSFCGANTRDRRDPSVAPTTITLYVARVAPETLGGPEFEPETEPYLFVSIGGDVEKAGRDWTKDGHRLPKKDTKIGGEGGNERHRTNDKGGTRHGACKDELAERAPPEIEARERSP
ncbi:hypothetical protein K438DRAFT_1756700 [Mycena galopus ATCC 62051]|nr:hypothetical protein K438DRAFT_1756700 [Mycena galopus ATCC 62051]